MAVDTAPAPQGGQEAGEQAAAPTVEAPTTGEMEAMTGMDGAQVEARVTNEDLLDAAKIHADEARAKIEAAGETEDPKATAKAALNEMRDANTAMAEKQAESRRAALNQLQQPAPTTEAPTDAPAPEPKQGLFGRIRNLFSSGESKNGGE